MQQMDDLEAGSLDARSLDSQETKLSRVVPINMALTARRDQARLPFLCDGRRQEASLRRHRVPGRVAAGRCTVNHLDHTLR